MDMPHEGSRTSRRRRGARKNKTRVAEAENTVVTKDQGAPVHTPVVAASFGAGVVKPKIIIAPPKPKVPKVLLVPKGTPTTQPRGTKKVFRAKRLSVVIDNTAKTQKHRKSMMTKVDEMTDDQIRAAAVHARLSRRETVAKAPIGLLRQMIKDYQIMKGRLL